MYVYRFWQIFWYVFTSSSVSVFQLVCGMCPKVPRDCQSVVPVLLANPTGCKVSTSVCVCLPSCSVVWYHTDLQRMDVQEHLSQGGVRKMVEGADRKSPILRSLARLSTIKCALPTIAAHFKCRKTQICQPPHICTSPLSMEPFCVQNRLCTRPLFHFRGGEVLLLLQMSRADAESDDQFW